MRARRWLPLALPAALVLALGVVRARAQTSGRVQTLEVPVTRHTWWLTRWADDTVACELAVEHEGPPRGQEIFQACGAEVYEDWADTEPCPAAEEGGDTSACQGLYLQYLGAEETTKEIQVLLPSPQVWLSLPGCQPRPPGDLCSDLPTLRLTAEEPLPNEFIVAVRGTVDGIPFACRGALCPVRLRPTGARGAVLRFWAESSLGDVSPTFTARVKVVPAEPGRPEAGWYVDVLSSQWRGDALATCSLLWEAFPPETGLPLWLTTPEQPEDLASDEPYALLAGVLIRRGAVAATDCPAFGLTETGAANACGLERARPLVDAWQDRFDETIFQVARETGVPARLMKNLFARESQFWPNLLGADEELGLGQLTPEGTDTTLLWNRDFYDGFCPLVLSAEACARGYAHLSTEEQALLRGALFQQVDPACATCPLGIDLSRAHFSVTVFAETLLAHCQQVGWMVQDITGEVPGAVSGYEDLWRFTLASYNAGPGCLATALSDTWRAREPLDWEHLAANLTPACQGAVEYVEGIVGE